jgi:hypothetical protein
MLSVDIIQADGQTQDGSWRIQIACGAMPAVLCAQKQVKLF